MQIKDRKEVTSKYGQKTITGKIVLTEDTKMLNKSNDGKTPFDYNWNKNSSLIVKAGTEVDYRGQEMRMYFYHEVWITTDKGTFSAVKEDPNHPCTRS
jgi:hypothetical protein